ncbi:MAG: hypothetical protein ACO3LA_06115, partial [Ilumatobacteraceae bacterium]
RCHRIGQEGSVTATYMLAGGTIDEEIYGLIDEKRAVVNAAIDGIEVEAGESNASRIISLFTEKGDL